MCLYPASPKQIQTQAHREILTKKCTHPHIHANKHKQTRTNKLKDILTYTQKNMQKDRDT